MTALSSFPHSCHLPFSNLGEAPISVSLLTPTVVILRAPTVVILRAPTVVILLTPILLMNLRITITVTDASTTLSLLTAF